MIKLIFISVLVLIYVGKTSGQTKMKSPQRETSQTTENLTSDFSWSYQAYKRYVSPVRGQHCPLIPSCSQYAKMSFSKFGFFYGFIMMADRLTRCGHDLRHYNLVWHQGNPYYKDYVNCNCLRNEKNEKSTFVPLPDPTEWSTNGSNR